MNRIDIIHTMCVASRVPVPEGRVIYDMLVVALPSFVCEKAKTHIRSMLAFLTARDESDPLVFMEVVEKLARESIAEVRLRDPPPVRGVREGSSQPRVGSLQDVETANLNTHEMMYELGSASQEVRYEAVVNCLSSMALYEDVEEDEPSVAALALICAAIVDDNGSASPGFCCPVIDGDGVVIALSDANGLIKSFTCWACGKQGHLARDCKESDGSSLPFRPAKDNAPFKTAVKGGRKVAGAYGKGKSPVGGRF